MKERIQKILASRGIASRRAVEKMILAGRISCNGHVAVLGETADLETDKILLDGKPIPTKREDIYIMLNKPSGYVTTMSDEKGRKCVSELVKSCGERVFPVGRLDMDSEGLLIFTNDGEFANYLMHPRHQVNKTYYVDVTGYSDLAVENLKRQNMLEGHKISPPNVSVISSVNDRGELHITIHEGRNRQVRKMCAAAGMRVQRLVRIREGALWLGDLPSGKWRHLTESEIIALKTGFCKN